MPYNLTAISTNTTGLVSFWQGINTHLMNNMFGVVILIGVSLVFLLGFYFSTRAFGESVAGAAFISLLLSLCLNVMGLLSGTAIFICVFAAGISAAFLWANKR